MRVSVALEKSFKTEAWKSVSHFPLSSGSSCCPSCQSQLSHSSLIKLPLLSRSPLPFRTSVTGNYVDKLISVWGSCIFKGFQNTSARKERLLQTLSGASTSFGLSSQQVVKVAIKSPLRDHLYGSPLSSSSHMPLSQHQLLLSCLSKISGKRVILSLTEL